MTRSPLISTICAIIPLAAMGWPLMQVIQPPAAAPAETTSLPVSGSQIRADISLKSAHPYSSAEVSIGDVTCRFLPEEDLKEIVFTMPPDGKISVMTSIVWPADTPESAALVEIIPDHLEARTHTLWGISEATEEFSCQWDLSK